MGLQLIFCVETNKKCKSDYIYIKNTIDRFYSLDQAWIKLSFIYMDGKGNYDTLKNWKNIDRKIHDYSASSKSNHSKVIFCFDCDDYDTKSEDKKFLDNAKRYCEENGYDFVWFCKEIESVYLERRVSDGEKKKQAELFQRKCLIKDVNEQNLRAELYRDKHSNLCIVLDKYLKTNSIV